MNYISVAQSTDKRAFSFPYIRHRRIIYVQFITFIPDLQCLVPSDKLRILLQQTKIALVCVICKEHIKELSHLF